MGENRRKHLVGAGERVWVNGVGRLADQKPARGLAGKEQGKQGGRIQGAWSGAKMPDRGKLRGRKREGGRVILHPDGWLQQQPRQVNSGTEARRPPSPAGSVLVTILVKP